MRRIQQRIYELLEVAHPDDTASRATDLFLFVLIALNVVAVIVETVEDVATQYAVVFEYFEVFSVGVFTIEYVLRLWTCVVDRRYASSVGGRIRFAGSWHAVVDILAILPFYLPMFLSIDLRVIRALRFFRLLRFLKLSRYSESMRIFGKVLRSERSELLVALFVAGVLLVIGSSFLYLVEHQAQPEVFSSIPSRVGSHVTTGHTAVIHGATVGDHCSIGMGALLLNGASVGPESIVGAGAVLAEGKEFAARSLILGVPGKVLREVTEQEIERIYSNAETYLGYAREYLEARGQYEEE